jgi:hypothetical protein
MARITHVKAAQQRYEQVPVIDPETGQQKQTPVMGKNGQQKVTKRGKPVFLSVTMADKTKPLPNRNCGKCGVEIKVGDPYKHISPRSGPYGGRTLYRCAACPSWHVWEYSSSLSARLAEISFNFSEAIDSAESEDDVQTALGEAAEAVREIAQEKGESADNIESGFQHETEQSQELRDISEQLDSWADEIENATIPDFPEPEEAECEFCDDGTTTEIMAIEDIQAKLTEARNRMAVLRQDPVNEAAEIAWLARMRESDPPIDNKAVVEVLEIIFDLEDRLTNDGAKDIPCDVCDGSGRVEPDEPTSDQIDEWRDEVRNDLSIVDESPV